MFVIENVILAVPEPTTVGAVAKFHLRMRQIRLAAGLAGMERLFLA